MQSMSCRIASQSETMRQGAVCMPVCLSVLVRAPVPILVPMRRIGCQMVFEGCVGPVAS